MSLFNNPWGQLKLSAGNLISSAGYRIPAKNNIDNFVEFRARPLYKNVYVYLAQAMAVQLAHQQVSQLYANYKRDAAKKAMEHVIKQQKTRLSTLIDHQNAVNKPYGMVTCEPGKQTIWARDACNRIVPEALMLYFNDEVMHDVKDEGATVKDKNNEEKPIVNPEFKTTTVCHIDLAPQITPSSAKNIVLTQVQGRDYSRKELVSGGDISFSVSGNIASFEPGVYPSEAVKKFIQVMQYNGILNVHNLIFDQFNVKRVIVKEFSLGHPTYKNIQPYSFTCVAVEPDEAVKVQHDTITVINKALELSTVDKWYKLILDHKLAEIAANTVENIAINAVTDGVALGLDSLVSLI